MASNIIAISNMEPSAKPPPVTHLTGDDQAVAKVPRHGPANPVQPDIVEIINHKAGTQQVIDLTRATGLGVPSPKGNMVGKSKSKSEARHSEYIKKQNQADFRVSRNGPANPVQPEIKQIIENQVPRHGPANPVHPDIVEIIKHKAATKKVIDSTRARAIGFKESKSEARHSEYIKKKDQGDSRVPRDGPANPCQPDIMEITRNKAAYKQAIDLTREKGLEEPAHNGIMVGTRKSKSEARHSGYMKKQDQAVLRVSRNPPVRTLQSDVLEDLKNKAETPDINELNHLTISEDHIEIVSGGDLPSPASTWNRIREKMANYVQQDNLYYIPTQGLEVARKHMSEYPNQLPWSCKLRSYLVQKENNL
ncbi:hypothetical protein PGT21_032674 [Puccinia graminis f. sp. tritici]|uniref:Uncharacterized protein n=1 Tax=Puccinia graminis f. sp. tritici TaxID=56615 RepID=A0A5B0PHF5_PUCGR|nr:hypothetical protein PGT21_032674 [Puccinia graminis f. sp. tritici]